MKSFWQDLIYLKNGSKRQQEAYDAITSCNVMKMLAPFDPILVGTIPIGIDLPESDLDIICEVYNRDLFCETINLHFSGKENFHIRKKEIDREEVCLARFYQEGFEFELFGQDVPVNKQHAYRHMVIEEWLLKSRGAVFREKIIALKKSGFKTELAFAKLLGLKGNPYEALLRLEDGIDVM